MCAPTSSLLRPLILSLLSILYTPVTCVLLLINFSSQKKNRCAMSGRNGRPGNVCEEESSGSQRVMLVTSVDHTRWQVSPASMAATRNSGVEDQSLLCTESLPSSTPPADNEQLPAKADGGPGSSSVQVSSAWQKVQQLPTKDVQFTLIVPETFLSSHPHVLARVPIVSSGEDGHGASGAVLTVGTDDSVGQDGHKSSGSVGRLVPGQAVYREVSLVPASLPLAVSTTTFNGVDSQRLVSSSAILLPTLTTQDGSEHLTHLAEVALRQKPFSPSSCPSHTQQQSQQQSPTSSRHSPVSEGMHSGRPSTGSGHTQGHPSSSSSSQDIHPPHTMLSAGASAGPSTAMGVGMFRGSLTHGEPVSRVLSVSSNQYASGGNNGSSSVSPYSSLYSVHGQSSPMASITPYSSFFHQYPGTHYSPSTASLVAQGRYPHIESYSAVLASMGSHIQHGGHTSPHSPAASRPPFLPASLSQYRSLSSSSSPGPAATHSPSGATPSYARDREPLLQQTRDRERSPPHHLPPLSVSDMHPDDKGLLHSPGLAFVHRGSTGSLLKEAPKADPRDPFHKLPSGKEGSLKHRILTRPPDIPVEGPYSDSKHHFQVAKGEEETAAKRTKYHGLEPAASSSSPPDPHVFVVPQALGPGSSGSRYPHDTMGSSSSPSSQAAATSSVPPSSQHAAPAPANLSPPVPPHLHYPPHFVKGSIIQLANGDLKRVEDLQTDDFVSSAQVSADLKVDSSTVVRIEEHPELGTATLGFSVGEHRVQVTVEATLEHPFFVFGQGWSSCSTERTLHRYGLECSKLSVGDVCISLTHKEVTLRAAEISSQQQQATDHSRASVADTHKESRHHDPEAPGGSGRGQGQKEEGHSQGHGQLQGNSHGVGGVSDTGSKSGVSDSGRTGEMRGMSEAMPHAQSPGELTSHSPSSQSPLPDSRPPRKRRWSAPESDVEKEKVDLEKQQSDPSEKAN